MTLFFIQNHILPFLKSHIFIGKKYGLLSFNNFLNEISKIRNLERRVAANNRNKCKIFRKKSHRIENEVPSLKNPGRDSRAGEIKDFVGGIVGFFYFFFILVFH